MAHLVELVNKFKKATVGEKGQKLFWPKWRICGGNENPKREEKGGLGNESGPGGSVVADVRPESILPNLGSIWNPSWVPRPP